MADLEINLQPDITEFTENAKNRIIDLTNELISISNKNRKETRARVNNFKELNSELLTFLFENICNTILIDKIQPIGSREDEVHNIQAIIDSLSLDILHEDLSYLTGESIYRALKAGKSFHRSKKLRVIDLSSIEYLLDILKSVKEWMESKNAENTEQKIENCKQFELSSNEVFCEIQEPEKEETEVIIEKQEDQTFQEFEKNKEQQEDEEEDRDVFDSYMISMKEEYKKLQNSLSHNLSIENKSIELDKDEEKVINNDLKHISNDLHERFNSLLNQKANDCDESNEHEEQNEYENYLVPVSCYESPIHDTNSNINIIPRRRTLSNSCDNYNEFIYIRNKLNQNKDFETSVTSKYLKNLYTEDLKDMKSIMGQSINKLRSRSELISNLYLKTTKDEKNHKPGARISQKGFLIPNERVLIPQKSKKRAMSVTSGTSSRRSKMSSLNDEDLLNAIFDQFPFLYTSPETVHYLWQKNTKQINLLNRIKAEIRNKYLKPEAIDDSEDPSKTSKNLTLKRLDEIKSRQQLLMEIVRTEQDSLRRKDDLKRKQLIDNSIKARQREQRFHNARVKRFYEEYRLQQKYKMLKHTAEEEQIVKNLFNDIFKLQKERILDLKKYAKEKYKMNTKKECDELESIENFYKSKFNLLKESVEGERQELQVREKCQHEILNKLRVNLSKKLQSEIKELQDQMCTDKNETHWRRIDGDNFKRKILESVDSKYIMK